VSFLKKLGLALFNFVKSDVPAIGAVSSLLIPFLGSGSKAAAVVTTGVNDLTAIGQQVLTIETALNGKVGTDKLAAAIPLVGNIVKTSELVSGKKIKDEALFTKAVEGFTQSTVDLLNSLE